MHTRWLFESCGICLSVSIAAVRILANRAHRKCVHGEDQDSSGADHSRSNIRMLETATTAAARDHQEDDSHRSGHCEAGRGRGEHCGGRAPERRDGGEQERHADVSQLPMLDGVLVERDRTLGMPATTSSSAQTASTVNTTTAAHRSRSRLAVVVEQALNRLLHRLGRGGTEGGSASRLLHGGRCTK